MQIEFEKKLIELGLSCSFHNDGLYTITTQKGGGNHIFVRLISSLPSTKQLHGSKNGNDVQAVGRFKFKFPTEPVPDILVFTIPNIVNNQIEFIVIPNQEFLKRHFKLNPGSIRRKRVGLVLWIMEDKCVYDTTNISPEGEWFFFSKGENGRMADATEIDYSEYLNSWQRLNV